ncbi:MAG: hypothetical protein RLZ12_261 [Bacillota bacterium]|jgi:Uma2 family endonuclease
MNGVPITSGKEKFTYKDYLTWSGDERWELIDGIPFNMSPSPSRKHQKIIGKLNRYIDTYLDNKTCEVYIAPFDVLLPSNNTKETLPKDKPKNAITRDTNEKLTKDTEETLTNDAKEALTNEKIVNIVQPDLTIICDKNKLTKNGCTGVPDLVVEVLSPATAKKDRNEKFKLYEQVGIREYWIIDPTHETIEVFLLVDNAFKQTNIYSKSDTFNVGIFPDLAIDLKKIFQD